MRLLRTLFEQDRGGEPGRCGQVFRIALSPHVFEKEREGRPLTFALEYHDEQLLAVLLRAGSVVLPADHSVIEAMARRKDVQLPDAVALLVQNQMLVLARQRLAFAWGAHVRRDDPRRVVWRHVCVLVVCSQLHRRPLQAKRPAERR